MVLIFTQKVDDNLAGLVKAVDEIQKNNEKLGTVVVGVSGVEEADFEKLQDTHKLTTALTVAKDKDGPTKYELNKEAAVTVVVYKKGGVVAKNFAFKDTKSCRREGQGDRRGRRGSRQVVRELGCFPIRQGLKLRSVPRGRRGFNPWFAPPKSWESGMPLRLILLALLPLPSICLWSAGQTSKEGVRPINVASKPIATDKSVKFDYDIVYVRAPRKGDAVGTNWPEISNPVFMDAGADLMLIHPDGTEELLVKGGAGSVTDPMVSYDGEWVYYSLFHDLAGASIAQGPAAGADIFKIHVKSRKIVRLTHQEFTPNTGAANWIKDYRTPETGKNHIEYGVFNMGPCPLPGGRVIFASNRNAFKPPKRLPHTLQLFVMDDDGANVECIGHLNVGMALHPVVLADGRVMFSSLESQGLRSSTLWGLWNINPDGTAWGPLASAFFAGGNPSAWHFQTQLSDGSIVAEEYYSQTSSGFGGLVKFPATIPSGEPPSGPDTCSIRATRRCATAASTTVRRASGGCRSVPLGSSR